MIKYIINKKNVHVAISGVGINANSDNNKDSVPLKSPGWGYEYKDINGWKCINFDGKDWSWNDGKFNGEVLKQWENYVNLDIEILNMMEKTLSKCHGNPDPKTFQILTNVVKAKLRMAGQDPEKLDLEAKFGIPKDAIMNKCEETNIVSFAEIKNEIEGLFNINDNINLSISELPEWCIYILPVLFATGLLYWLMKEGNNFNKKIGNPILKAGYDCEDGCCCGGSCSCCCGGSNNNQNVSIYKRADVPLAWGLYFQDGASPSFEGIVDLHNRIMFYLVVILFGVTWIMVSLIWNFNNSSNKLVYRYLNHGTLIELIWTVGPALVLVAIAFPSFKLLYLMDEVIDPAMTVKCTGHQWYWEYEYADFLNEENETINFDSYMKDEASLEKGELRMLEVDNPVVLPVDTHIRFIITGADVLHDWAVPSLGIKVDACPGRLNQASVIIERTGHFYGQCSEICGVLHSSMPIKIEAVEVEKFFSWLLEQ
jgi:cytochrome c oxidase subunit 2